MISAPLYEFRADGSKVGLAVESMSRHTTDEGWQLFRGLESAGYGLAGHGLTTRLGAQSATSITDVTELLKFDPSVVVIQDKREWIGKTAGGPRTFDQRERFRNMGALRDRDDVFKIGVLKDAQSDRDLHREFAEETGLHAWIVYYDPDVVAALAPFVRRQHLVRTWHTTDKAAVPEFSVRGRKGCIVSGALGGAYPLRTRVAMEAKRPNTPISKLVDVLPHPGYGRTRCWTPDYLQTLSRYKVAICTASIHGYALRKIMEATACGCRVVTNLREHVPLIDANLVRVADDIGFPQLCDLLSSLDASWDANFQEQMAFLARERYEFREQGRLLAREIENVRRFYGA